MAFTINLHRLSPIFLLIVASSLYSSAAAGDPPDPIYRTHASEVRLTFSVTDQNQHGVATLQASDFAVVDKEIIVRNFQSFTRPGATKLEIAMLVDASGSMLPRFRRETSDVLDLLAQTAGVPEENISVFSFAESHPKLLCAADCRSSHAAEQIPLPRIGDLTPLYDTILDATDYLAQHADQDAEKVLIIISDGQDTVSRNSLRDATDAAINAGVEIYALDFNSNNSNPGSAVLYRLACATGGRYFWGMNSTDRATNAILEDFNATYVITYKLPSHDSGFHALRILPTHNSTLQFRSRSGYYFDHR